MAHSPQVPELVLRGAQDLKMFLIQDAPTEGGMLVLENVFVLDAASRSVAREEVLRETDSEDPLDNILRIRCALGLRVWRF